MTATISRKEAPAQQRSAADTVALVRAARLARFRRRRAVIVVLAAAIVVMYAVSLMVGQTFYTPAEVIGVIAGHDVPGASFTVGTLRLPRASLALLTGLCFGLSGVTFQTMLRNPLASPDIIGISSGASAAAVFSIVILGLTGAAVSAVAIVAGLGVALAVYLLSYRSGVAGIRLVLIGIGVGAMFNSVVSWVLQRAPQYELQEAMRWLTGSLNSSAWSDVVPVLAALTVLGPVLLVLTRNLGAIQLGDPAAAALGVRVEQTRVWAIIAAVGLIAFATAAAGPIAFVAFLSGPIAARLVGPRGSLLLPAALVGALLVLVADLCAQYVLGTRYPVGVVTGVLGAPYLLYLLVRINRTGGAL